jgi:SnoaL-like domain
VIMIDDPLTPQRVAAIALAFAQALDADDFTAAGRLLADDCAYEAPAETLVGRAAIMASYAAASAWVVKTFDDVRYESVVERVTGRTAEVCFIDYLAKAPSRWHRYRCRQLLTLDPTGAIVRIVHNEIDGERAALETYFRACGIEPRSP